MKNFLILAALALSSLSTFAQVEAEVVVDQDKFLPAETLIAGVRIVNRSGQTLKLGEDADWIKFNIEKPNDFDFVPNGFETKSILLLFQKGN